jgi:PAS domain S-box-containing protein
LEWLPIVELGTGRVAGVEALLRVDVPGSTTRLVAAAERSGDMVPVGRWVLDTALSTVAAAGAPEPLRLSVNLTLGELLDHELPGVVAAALARSGHPPEALHLEISERSLAAPVEVLVDAMAPLKRLGVQLSIDDFGTGVSSLSLLHSLPVDELKIDRSFVARMHEDNRSSAIVRAVVSLARSLQLRTLAEGVETDVQERMLLGLRCTSAQGWLYSPARPTLADAVDAVDPDAIRRRTDQDSAALWSGLGSERVAARLVEAAFAETPIGMAIIDGTGTQLAVNPPLCQLLGVPATDLVGRSCWDVVHPDDVARDQAQLDAVLRGEAGGYAIEARLVGPDGTEHWVEVTVAGAPGEPSPLRGTTRLLRQVRSIEDRRRADERQAILAAVVDASADAIIVAGADGRITHWNPAAEQLSGVAAADALGTSAGDLLAPKDRVLARTVLGGQPIRLSDVELAAAGEDVPVDVTVSPIPGGDGGSANAYVAIVRDMREQRAAAEARERLHRALEAQAADLLAANERLSSLGATLSHDLQQPLVALGGFLHLLGTRGFDASDADAKEWVEAAARSQRRLSDAVQALARTALGVPVQLEPVDLELLVGEAVEDLEPHGLGLTVHIGSIPPVLGDHGMLSRVVANLLSNSARYRHPDRPPVVRVEHRSTPDSAVVVAFADNGRGFRDDELDAVFRGGLRGSAATGTAGTGTGLAIVRRTIAALDGRVWAERGDPHGAVVCIGLRPADGRDESRPAAASTPA